MDDEVFKSALEAAYRKLSEMLVEQASLNERRAQLEQDIARWEQKTVHLAALCEDMPEESGVRRLMKAMKNAGLTDAIRSVFRAADQPLGAMDVKKRLVKNGFDIEGYQNILATIHVTLTRLHKGGEIDEQVSSGGKGKRVYVWSPIQPIRSYLIEDRPKAIGPILDVFSGVGSPPSREPYGQVETDENVRKRYRPSVPKRIDETKKVKK